MSTDAYHPSESHRSLDDILASYLRAQEAGQPLDRQELLARHPELAGELREFFANLDGIERLAAPLRPAAGTPFQPRQFGDYMLLEEIGRGGMGVVFKARHTHLDRIVALKILPAGPLASEADRQRFLLEAQATATLDHPNLVPVYEVGEHDGLPFFSMQFVAGGNLSDWLNGAGPSQDPQQPRRAAQLVATIARAVQHAHQRGIIHRDLKPANVLIAATETPGQSGVPKVVDFGLAKWRERDAALTETNAVVGTASYMAPEQATPSAGQITTAVDVYGLGAILYESLTSRPPFIGAALEVLRQVQERSPILPRALNPNVDRDLEQICCKCLEKDPQRRYGSADALADDLDRWLAGKPILARPVGLGERLWRWAARHPWEATAALLAALALFLALFAGYTWRRRTANAEAATLLARGIQRQFRLVGNLVTISAERPELRQVLERAEADPALVHRDLLHVLGGARKDFNQWFALEGNEPLVNLFVMGNDGILLADSGPRAGVVGHDFRERDYFAGAVQAGRDVYFSRVFKSRQDGLYKFAVVAPIRSGQRRLGYLAAAMPVDGRLVTLDLADELPGALLAGPMDWHYTDQDMPEVERFPFVAVLHPDYREPGAAAVAIRGRTEGMLHTFQADPVLRQAADHISERGGFVDFARVGDTAFVVVLEQPYPWPFPWLLTHWHWVIGTVLAVSVAILVRSKIKRTSRPNVESRCK